MRVLSFIFLVSISLLSCSDDEKPNFSNKEFLEMARRGDPDLKLILPKDISQTVVQCGDYEPACRYGLKVVVKKVELKALFYDEQKNALKAAKRIEGYVSRNWVLDDVRGEPILERFVTEYLEAKKASEVKLKD